MCDTPPPKASASQPCAVIVAFTAASCVASAAVVVASASAFASAFAFASRGFGV